ncbi:hypothetical protein DKT77_12850 [Meridianimarinicoccus roseus]|uniref:Uncharacterized protein n=1 Tax=Meridianimarinicoccus roseus TaxID=2072018 RepID=A0A2V2LF71_9RHOB|nr:hypothetical protein [Meridianimarinicoccus roseus]PWR02154.1 hypothetical protein DKT77_12850 [Meridianimarinicoccus roseus]
MQYTNLTAGNRARITYLDGLTGTQRKAASRKYDVNGQRKPKQHVTDPGTGKPRAQNVSVWEFESAQDTPNRTRYRLIRRSKLGATTWYWAEHLPGNTFRYIEITGYPPIIPAVLPPAAPAPVPAAPVVPPAPLQLEAEESDSEEEVIPESWEDL